MIKPKRLLSLFGTLSLTAGLMVQLIAPSLAHAATPGQITARSLTLEAGSTDANGDGVPDYGGSMAGGLVNHLFKFTLPSTDAIGSIKFQYCTTAAPVPGGVGCIAPTGIDVSGATLGQEDATVSGFSGMDKTNEDDDTVSTTPLNTVILERGAAAAIAANSAVTYRLDGITNPTTPNQTFFVRISTYASLDGTGSAIDSGTVAASTTNQIVLDGTMPESLVFCTGHTIDINGSGVPDCTTASSGAVSFNQLFSPSSTSWATSQMAASTNAGAGYAITVTGPTLTSGSNVINAIGATADISRLDTRQFGLNLIDDSTPPSPLVTDPTIGSASTNPITYYNGDSAGTGGAINPASDGASYMAAASSGFDGSGDPTASNLPTYSFAAGTPNIVAKSDNGTGTSGPTNTQRYTATYIVNVSGNLPAGSYTSTLTYICTPTF